VTPTFEFSSSELGSTFECRLNGGSFAPCSTPHTTPALSDGDHTFDVRARDPVGNQDASPDSRAFTVDTTPAADPGAPGDPAGGGDPSGDPAGPGDPSGDPAGPGDPNLPDPGPPLDVTGPTARLGKTSVTLGSNGVAGVAVGCGEPCTGNVVLTTRDKVNVRTSARRKVKLGSKSFTTAGPGTVVVKVKLSKKNRRLVAKLRKLRVVATVTARDALGNRRVTAVNLTLKAPKKRR
jgi:hypothetical protein